VLGADRRVALAREDLAVARDAVRAVERRLELGVTSQLEVNAARAEGGRAARAVAVATRRAAAARAELRTLLGSDAGAPLELAGELPRPTGAAPLDADALGRRALEARADLAAVRREVAAAEAERRVAKREALPVPAIGAKYSREEGADIVLGTLTFDLPLFNRNQAGRGVASARLARAKAELAAAERRAPLSTGRTESQGLGITEAQDLPPGAQGAPSAPPGMGNGAHMGRGKLPVNVCDAAALEELGRQVAEAIALGQFDRARELTEEGIRLRATAGSARDPVRGAEE
jgi:hypothetical protein